MYEFKSDFDRAEFSEAFKEAHLFALREQLNQSFEAPREALKRMTVVHDAFTFMGIYAGVSLEWQRELLKDFNREAGCYIKACLDEETDKKANEE